MERLKNAFVAAAVIACVGLAALVAFAGGGGTQWFDWLGFEGWPNGVHKELSELTDDGVSVNITAGDGGLFVVGDSGHEEFGQRSLLAGKAGILLTFLDPETGRGAREFVFSTRSIAAGIVPVVYCYTDDSQIGIRNRLYRVSQGEATYVNTGFHESSDARYAACLVVNGALDQIVVRK